MEDFFSFITSPELQRKLLPLKILFFLVSFGLAGLIIFLLRKTDWLKYYFGQDLTEFRSFKALETVEFAKKWTKTKKRLEKGWESEAKLALIEADQLLDELLKRTGYKGESLGERLKQLDNNVLPNIEEVWEAHKIRNNIVHDPDYKLSLAKANQMIEVYEKAFQHLEAI